MGAIVALGLAVAALWSIDGTLHQNRVATCVEARIEDGDRYSDIKSECEEIITEEEDYDRERREERYR